MAQFAEAIPHLLLRVFAPALGITLVAWLVMLFVQLFSGKRHSCRAASPRYGLGKPVWAGLFALAVACTTLCGKHTNGVQGVGGPLLQFNPPIVLTVTPQNITNGWRVAEESGAEAFAKSLSDFGATVVNLNAAGILAAEDLPVIFTLRDHTGGPAGEQPGPGGGAAGVQEYGGPRGSGMGRQVL